MTGEARIKRAVESLVRAGNPAQETSALLTGEVLKVKPLEIRVVGESRIEKLTEEFLFVSFLCKRYVLPNPHKHYTMPHQYDPVKETDEETEEIELWRGLEAGDKVKLLRLHGGQLFYVLERLEMEGAKEKGAGEEGEA